MNYLCITILAGGLGKRMNSTLPKVLHKVNNKPMIVYIIETSLKLNPKKIMIVVGCYKDIIKETIDNYIQSDIIEYVLQETPSGTGDAVKSTLSSLLKSNENVNNIILNGDVPMLKYETIRDIYQFYLDSKSELLITTIKLKNPFGFGRICFKQNRQMDVINIPHMVNEFEKFQVDKIIEEKDCSPEEKLIDVVNCGIYITNKKTLLECIPQIKNNNAQKEYYITDIVHLCKGMKIGYILPENKFNEIYNINTADQLNYVNTTIRSDP